MRLSFDVDGHEVDGTVLEKRIQVLVKESFYEGAIYFRKTPFPRNKMLVWPFSAFP